MTNGQKLAAAAVQYRPSVNRPLYRLAYLNCPFQGGGCADLKLAEQEAENHAKDCRHRVRLSFDLLDVEVTTYSGGDPGADRTGTCDEGAA